ncbi:hypothetical protein [Microbacterium kribbense]|uniref:hypothetical protein n=1 Tax=Microbacterium kribbense TaxID=433645 RepID=UPI0031DF8FF8
MAVRIHDFTGGISRYVATGPLDSSDDAAAVNAGVDALAADPGTAVIVVVATFPAPDPARAVLERLAAGTTPAVVCFVGADAATVALGAVLGVAVETRSKPAALAAVITDGVDAVALDLHPLNEPLIAEVRALLGAEQRYIRGLFVSGGLRAEAVALARERHADVREDALEDGIDTPAHVFWDLGTESGTGPHAKTDAAERSRRLVAAASNPEVGVVVLDFVLGEGASDDPVGAMLPAIHAAKDAAAARGRHLEILGYVLGTDLDPQGLATQTALLGKAGVTWASSATNTGLLAREFVIKG